MAFATLLNRRVFRRRSRSGGGAERRDRVPVQVRFRRCCRPAPGPWLRGRGHGRRRARPKPPGLWDRSGVGARPAAVVRPPMARPLRHDSACLVAPSRPCYFTGTANRALAGAIVAGDAAREASIAPSANPNAVGWNGMTFMRLALEQGHAKPDVVAALLRAGAGESCVRCRRRFEVRTVVTDLDIVLPRTRYPFLHPTSNRTSHNTEVRVSRSRTTVLGVGQD